jgi:hypothetical protein
MVLFSILCDLLALVQTYSIAGQVLDGGLVIGERMGFLSSHQLA